MTKDQATLIISIIGWCALIFGICFIFIVPVKVKDGVTQMGERLCKPNGGLLRLDVNIFKSYPYKFYCEDGMESGWVDVNIVPKRKGESGVDNGIE